MNDADIRPLLYPLLTGGVYIDELPTGTTRADVVHITEQFMHGYELKGDADTLQRVPRQLPCYGRAYDFVTFVVTEKHLAKLLPLLPEWVGVLVASPAGLQVYRPAEYNATVERPAVAGLLRVSEIKQFLLAQGLPGISVLRRRDILSFLRTTRLVSLADLAHFVRRQLLSRYEERLLLRAERKAERDRAASRRKRRPKHK
ncbi:sce7726 family protein [Hymenobacter sp. ISL-91]|uniref:sce7726 family protein n=1 Tax=Hymenobacter sp. ISL-91 TaxID=2819151 RepID=UPI001BEB6CB5|nr:sce7726 family protein [Hymenobacter sp. ISL-91]MBT2557433.1 sce7726 family protein [Hymenobacter sp. ISL-91]